MQTAYVGPRSLQQAGGRLTPVTRLLLCCPYEQVYKVLLDGVQLLAAKCVDLGKEQQVHSAFMQVGEPCLNRCCLLPDMRGVLKSLAGPGRALPGLSGPGSQWG